MRPNCLRLPVTFGFIALLLSGLTLLFGPGPRALAMAERHIDGHLSLGKVIRLM